MAAIFVSYRRSDSSDVTGRIFDHLKARFGQDSLFKDVDSIGAGEDFRAAIASAVGQCSVLLAVVGKGWLTAAGPSGARRIDDPDDFVRIEVASALARGIPVVPVLVGNAVMPTAEELPGDLMELAFRNAVPVRPDPDFRNDITRLCDQIAGRIPGASAPPASPTRRRTWALASAGVVLVAAGAAAGYWKLAAPPRAEPTGARPGATQVEARPIRFWLKRLPKVPGGDARKLFTNALGSWQAVLSTSIVEARSEAEANVIVSTAPDTVAVATLGPPSAKVPTLEVVFGSAVAWQPKTFEAAACRMLGHVLGLGYTSVRGQVMTESAELETLPLTPQADDIQRVRRIWNPAL